MINRAHKSSLKIAVVCGSLFALGACANPANFNLDADGQSFQQNAEKVNNKIDILWVVDNSGSMDPFQQNLAANFSSFITNFQQKGFDFQMAVTATDAYTATDDYDKKPELAKFKDGISPNQTGWPIVTQNTPDLLNIFVKNATVGSKGSGDERVIQSLFTSLSSPLNSNFLRPGAFVAVVILSDEDDFTDFKRPKNSQSQAGGIKDHDYKNPGLIPIDDVVKQLDKLTSSKPNDRHYNVSAITITDEACRTQHAAKIGGAILGRRYMELAEKTNGTLGSICDTSFAKSLEFIQQHIAELATQFKLNRKPNPSTIRIVINGILIPEDAMNGWTYSADANAISFHGTGVPPAGADIRIAFDPIELK